MKISIPPEIERALREHAERLGTTAQELTLQTLRRQFMPPTHGEHSPEQPETLADFLGDSIGALHSKEYIPGGAKLSEHAKGALGKVQANRRRKGRS